ncbi:MAG: PIN domain-containing protein [Candidatus Jordarchaeales archaeon]|nr:PIN domain-containing protein [Candidatus Jordarchaeia archaeon]
MIVGLDTNILCYILDPAYPEHEKVKDVLFSLSPEKRVALSPPIIHEAYHTLVFGQKWVPIEAERRLKMILKHPYIEFYSQTKKTCTIALTIAARYNMGGRDALIAASLLANKVPTLYTHDQELLNLKWVSWRNFRLSFEDPLAT